MLMRRRPARGGFFLQGFLVLLSNPKCWVFFGAFIPQFHGHDKGPFLASGAARVTFMVTGAITDSIYGVLARGRARLFSRRGGRGCCRAFPAAS